jgi:hypothetical protein
METITEHSEFKNLFSAEAKIDDPVTKEQELLRAHGRQ